MRQQDLFDGIPAASPADPATSAEAAERVTASGVRGAHALRVLGLVREHPGRTAVELWAQQEGLERHEVSRRLSDLRHAGLVRQGEARTCSIKGSRMVVWLPAGG